LVIIAGTAFTYYYGDEIKQAVITHLNSHLKTEIEVTEVNFSLFQNFPMASVSFSDVLIYGAGTEKDTLVKAESIHTLFNVYELYRGNYVLRSLEIENGSCNIVEEQNGVSNYILWENEDDDSSSSFTLALDKFIIQSIQFTYQDRSENRQFEFFIENAELKGKFNEDMVKAELKSVVKEVDLSIGKSNLFQGKTLFIYTNGLIDQNAEKIIFTDANLGVDEMNFILNGFYSYGDESKIDINVKSKNVDLNQAIRLSPETITNKLNSYQIDGKVMFEGNVKGDVGNGFKPSLNFTFMVEDGSFNSLEDNISFQNTALNGSFSNGDQKSAVTSKLEVESFNTQFNNGSLSGNLLLENFKNPRYNYSATIDFSAQELAQLIESELIVNGEGNIKADINASGKLNQLDQYDIKDWLNSNFEGTAQFEDVSFEMPYLNYQFSALQGEVEIAQNNINTQNLNVELNGIRSTISGKFNNLIPFFLKENQSLFIDAELNSAKIDLEKLLPKSSPNNSTNDIDKTKSSKSDIKVYLNTSIGDFSYKSFAVKSLNTLLIFNDRRLEARNTSFMANSGSFQGNLYLKKENGYQLLADGKMTDVDISSLFTDFDNFGQQTLNGDHLSGTANIDFNYSSEWTKEFKVLTPTIQADIDIKIADGRLKDFKPIYSLSKYIELEELQEIKFKTLENQVLIKDESIFIPRFDIQSSAINLSIAGTHKFDNSINYKVNLLLSEILSKKAKKPKENEFGYVVEEERGRSRLFLDISGTASEPIVKYDSKAVKEKNKKQFQEEKQTIKGLLKEEFGLFKKDTSLKRPVIQKRQSPFKVEYDSSFYKNKNKELDKNSSKKASDTQEKEGKKSKFGKFLNKIAKPNKDEYVDPIED